ncbi:MAG: peptidylprolyl isomerase [Burkholderiales bacterium]|jgi:peptidyl-prolyl cis-trans isomerase SurA|nr:peptidylprolyl isomerase [Burkholderiales bacterium]
MKSSFRVIPFALFVACAFLFTASPAFAAGQETPSGKTTPTPTGAVTPPKSKAGEGVKSSSNTQGSTPNGLDRIAFIVNDEAVTQFEVERQKARVLKRLQTAKVTPPPAQELEHQIIEQMITEKALMQYARDSGIRADDTTVERAIAQVATDNKLSTKDLQAAVAREGLTFDEYREEIRKQLMLQRLREREADNRVVVTDAEVSNYLAMVKAQTGGEAEYLTAHILVVVPEQSSPQVINQRKERANTILKRLQKGEDFAQVAAAMSDAQDALTGGELGWRTLGKLPAIFAQEVGKLKDCQISPVLRSPAGFHIVKRIARRDSSAPTVVDQTHTRHILVRVSETVSEEEARQKIQRLEQRLKDGEPFETVARLASEDLSSSKGGDLGWLSAGDTVPEFERAMNALKPGEISPVIRSPFGWHIIQVVERRRQDVTEERQSGQARMALAQRKAEELFDDFVRQTRDNAYVEYKAGQ